MVLLLSARRRLAGATTRGLIYDSEVIFSDCNALFHIGSKMARYVAGLFMKVQEKSPLLQCMT